MSKEVNINELLEKVVSGNGSDKDYELCVENFMNNLKENERLSFEVKEYLNVGIMRVRELMRMRRLVGVKMKYGNKVKWVIDARSVKKYIEYKEKLENSKGVRVVRSL